MNVQPQIITEHSITHVFPRYAEISETDLRNGVQQNQALFVIDFKFLQKLMIAKRSEDWYDNHNLIIDDILRFHICKRVYNQYVNHEDYNGKIPLFGLLNLLSLCGFIRQHQIDNLYTERLEVYDHFFLDGLGITKMMSIRGKKGMHYGLLESYHIFPHIEYKDKDPVLKHLLNLEITLLNKEIAIKKAEHPYGYNHFNKHPYFYAPLKNRIYIQSRFDNNLIDRHLLLDSYHIKLFSNNTFYFRDPAHYPPITNKHDLTISQIVDDAVANLKKKGKK